MKKLNSLFLMLAVLLVAGTVKAQNMSDMRLNEVLVTNTDGYIDDYGNRSGWIELFNTSYGTVDIGGCYLSDDRNDLTKYMIPKGDVLTKVKPRQHALFFADGMKDRGTFHINFTLQNGGAVYFTSSDGRTVIDVINIPVDLPENVSYGRLMDGEGFTEPTHFLRKSYRIALKESLYGDENAGFGVLPKVTPSTNNVTLDGESKANKMAENDPTGGIMALTAMSVVFLALIILALVFKAIGNYSIKKASVKTATAMGDGVQGAVKAEEATKKGEVTAETYAAIAMACHLYKQETEAHDFENTILTINKTARSYSPWSSKIYTLRETPTVRKR